MGIKQLRLSEYVAIAVLALCAASSCAWSMYPVRLDAAVDQAQLIFIGTIASRVYAESDQKFLGIFTCFDFEVVDVLKGEIVTNKFTLRLPGGEYPDARGGVDIAGFPPSFNIGESYLLFIEKQHGFMAGRIPIYINLELIDYSGNSPDQLLINTFDLFLNVAEGISDGEFIFTKRQLVKTVYNEGFPSTFEPDPVLIEQSEPMVPASTVLNELRQLIHSRKDEITYIPVKAFSALSIDDVPELYSTESLVTFDNREGCGVKLPALESDWR